MLELVPRLFVGLLPVVVFLVFLIYLDSYKLVGLKTVLLTMLAGSAVAGASYGVDRWILHASGLELRMLSRYIAPFIEEAFKGAVVLALIRSHRIGFHVDAAILGFATGTGFALVENLYYLNLLPDSAFVVWIVRGFGTALMHGGVAAIFGVVAKSLGDRWGGAGVAAPATALLLAAIVHSFFNHFFFTPVLSAVLVVVVLPPLLALVFRRSERALQDWLGSGFDEDVRLLELIHSGEFTASRPGRYLHELAERFPGPVVADMLCYLRLYLELAVRAKGELMMRESGFRTEMEPETRAKFEEMTFLERSIGPTGLRAMEPFLHVSGRDLWQLYLLGKA